MPDANGVPHIQRCAHQEITGRLAWQCRLTDPHPDVDHQPPIDAEFGRDLDVQDPLWLAAKLRDQVAKTRHAQRQITEAEQRGYERGRSDFQFAPEGDNHHNAALCPYCSPQLEAGRG